MIKIGSGVKNVIIVVKLYNLVNFEFLETKVHLVAKIC